MTQQNTDKAKLLATQLHQLSITGAFMHMILRDWNTISLTLGEVISYNKEMIPGKNYLELGPAAKRSTLRKRTKAWQHFKTFLTDHGFTPEDWIHLLPLINTPKGMKPDFSKLSKETLLGLKIQLLFELKNGSDSLYSKMCKDFKLRNIFTVKKLLALTAFHFDDFFEYKSKSKIKEFKQHLHKIQQKMRGFGLTKEDGPFMAIEFVKGKTRSDLIAQLVTEKGLSEKAAAYTVNLAASVGWVRPIWD